MKKYLFCAVAVLCMASCEEVKEDILMDVPKVNFEEEQITVGAEGAEELIIPLKSTGVDDVFIVYRGGTDENWNVDSESGDLTSKEPWIEIVRVINDYDDTTRALAMWKSAIVVRIKANEGHAARQAIIEARSFTKSDQLTIIQLAE